MNARQKLRELLHSPEITQVPSVFDGISARLAQATGFQAISVTGNGVAASLLGRPDVGLVSLTESSQVARNIAGAVDIPVIFDADTGYGSALNVTRAVQEFENSGVAAIKLEDQVTPKRCGVLDVPIPVVTEREYLGKIEAALFARHDPDFLVIARTDAANTLGVEAAAHRAKRAIEAGADSALIIGVREKQDVETVMSIIDTPLLTLVEEKGPMSTLHISEIEKLGFSLALYPGPIRFSMAAAAKRALEALRDEGHAASVRPQMLAPDDWYALFDIEAYFDIEKRFVRGSGQAERPVS
ncbi:carboxyvinyl-carboxyphosphonate phosphorylmutase [Mycolicibacterium murale]|uniref:Carboxyvinyl-carboxyphosphonate phosphorylmutase n=1 Tax=Mycolicibacterium murale TaxID=182220 RepID=A0A7I9WNA1_9MYCO|nr:isocitrate lyase/PEP mutase family protein [Mycolicibacterium murale]MCV7185892.1 isocitrate lyase/PEP mutase family protein [Mycolicibacterium murale]GFG58808.1 carboxyvinyl-carboxyphosphonate phosphorylmutase [Mycolicibacterium murale]